MVAQGPIPLGSQADIVSSLLAPTPYRPIGLIGRGAMGEVHVVEHKFLGRRFALKVLRTRLAEEMQSVDRMRIEAQAAARLDHPNIVQIVDFWFAVGDRPCIVMELLDGRTLAAELVERRCLPLSEAIAFMHQLLSALAAAHDLGVVHRDIKPENLFLHQPADHTRILKVLDFGIARVLPNAPQLAPQPLNVPTKTGTFLGSPKYASPETVRGERVDHRADLYSAGLVFYAMLTGRGAFDRMGPRDEWSSFSVEPPSRYLGPGATRMDYFVLKAISYEKSERYQSARGLPLVYQNGARNTMPEIASARSSAEDVVLNVFCIRVDDDWLVMLNPDWAPQYLLHYFDANYETYPVQLDLEDLDRVMAAQGAKYTKRFAVTGSVELTAKGDAADALATWLSTAFSSSIRSTAAALNRFR